MPQDPHGAGLGQVVVEDLRRRRRGLLLFAGSGGAERLPAVDGESGDPAVFEGDDDFGDFGQSPGFVILKDKRHLGKMREICQYRTLGEEINLWGPKGAFLNDDVKPSDEVFDRPRFRSFIEKSLEILRTDPKFVHGVESLCGFGRHSFAHDAGIELRKPLRGSRAGGRGVQKNIKMLRPLPILKIRKRMTVPSLSFVTTRIGQNDIFVNRILPYFGVPVRTWPFEDGFENRKPDVALDLSLVLRREALEEREVFEIV